MRPVADAVVAVELLVAVALQVELVVLAAVAEAAPVEAGLAAALRLQAASSKRNAKSVEESG